jgi:tetratricopeptide (TPR) repeat protein
MRRAAIVLLAFALSSLPAAAAQSPAQSPRPPDAELLEMFRGAVELQRAGRLVDAEAAYRRFLEWQPNNIEALANLGVVYVNLGRYDEAIASYRQALERSHLNAPVRMNLALAYYKAGRFEEAVPEFERVLESNPDLYNARLLKADCLLQLGDYAAVVALLEPVAGRHEDDRAFNYVLGMALLQNDQAEEGLVHLDRILREGESAEARLLMGLSRRAASDFAGARDEFAKAVAQNPELPLAHSLHGQMLLSTGDRESARAAFLQELTINPNDFESNLLLGVILKEEQRFDEARNYLDHAATLRPSDPGVQYQLATLYLGEGRTEQALAILEPLVESSPDFVEAHVSLATAYYRLKRKDEGDRHREIVARLTAEAQARQPGAQAAEPQR